jgi:hypothetical protein
MERSGIEGNEANMEILYQHSNVEVFDRKPGCV